ncbi:Ig-like domain-containing protein [Cohnella nanjingensis]|uniref:Ig-like domain-containing protein n=1 Tax=Cohnella nanjingensis TaxID=1387779 RepID=UPI0028AB6273|nr:Ig-like domain-containing protein [Cohnella nanjingensis]
MLTFDSLHDGDSLAAGVVRIQGGYTGAYNVQLVANGSRIYDTHMEDPDGDESGTWYCDLDTSAYDGEVELAVRAADAATRYNAWSAFLRVTVHSPQAKQPSVTILSPADGSTVGGTVPIRVKVEATGLPQSVQVRIDGGDWLEAAHRGGGFSYDWDASGEGDRTHSIEARAIGKNGKVGRSLTTYVDTGAGSHETTTLVRQDRAMWIWENASYNLIYNPGSRAVLDAMASDTATFGQDATTTLYLGVDAYQGTDMLEDERERVRDFVAWAHGRGYRVQALIAGGTNPPYFGTYARYREQALREFEKVLNYNLASDTSERFDGINLDTEPYSLPDFHSAYPDVEIQYLDMLEALMQRKEASGLGIPVGPAIPRWYDTSASAQSIAWHGSVKWLSQHIQDTADYIAIMDYRDQAEGSVGIIQQAQGELDYAQSIGKPNSVVVGVETKDIADGGDPETISFNEEGRAYMESELDKVYAAFGDHPGFAGIAVHHYDSLRTLPSAWGPNAAYWQPPADTRPPGALSAAPVASAFDYQRIDIAYGRAYDDGEVQAYRVYRSEQPSFEPDPSLLAGTSRGLSFKDAGLLPDTRYYYRIAAIDMAGNEGPASAVVSARTGQTTLKPMIVSAMSVAYGASKGTVTLRVSNLETAASIPAAAVHGRFTHMAGRFVDAKTDADGMFVAASETTSAASGEIGFMPVRILAAGYYWASAYDTPHTASASWPS